MAHKNLIKIHGALFLAVLLWSSAFAAIRLGLEGFSPGSLALFRFGLASLCFIVPVYQERRFPRLSLKQILAMLVIGSVGIAGYSVLLNTGEQSLSPGAASFLVAQTPVITALLAIVWLQEKPSILGFIGILISFMGVGLMVSGQRLDLSLNMGVFLVLVATFCGSLQSILQKQMLKVMQPVQVTALSTWLAAGALMFFWPNLWQELKTAPTQAILAGIFLGLVPSTIGQWLWSYGLSRTMVLKASAYLYTMPLLSTTIAWLVLGELPQAEALLGGMIALGGAILVNLDNLKLAAKKLQA